ncbi:MAG: hypothetical protein LC135_04010 [Phycisphaerae bacterium]|nr:hypothetical protein [Phycisphaerae bacterium]MCZ2399016.1 hypothetical protein [Phycisphaerae bacterium]
MKPSTNDSRRSPPRAGPSWRSAVAPRLALAVFSLGGLLALLLTACRPAPQAAEPDVELRQDSPEQVAFSALRAIQAALRAQHRGEPEQARRFHAQLRSIAAERDIVARFERAPQYRMLLGNDEVVPGVIKNWIAAIAYYAEGVDFSQVTTARAVGSPDESSEPVLVRVHARGRDDDAWIQVRCVQGDDQRWRVSLITFHVPKGADDASLSPASRPVHRAP